MPKLDQKRLRDAVEKAFDAEVGVLFKTLIENLLEAASGAAGGFTKPDQCVGSFARSMKQLALAYDKACEVAEKMTEEDTKQ
jgi:DNA-binding ferritin-like protein